MSKRNLRLLLVLVLVAALAGAGARWYHVVTRPDHRLRTGEEAIALADWNRVERLASVLEADGYPAHAHLLRGEAFLKRKDLTHAAAEFRQIPSDQEDLYLAAAPLYGEAVLPLNRFEAEAAFLYVLKKRPDDLAAHRGLAEIYRRQQALLSARGHILELIRLDPTDGRSYHYLAQIDMAYERYDEGRDHLEEALRWGLAPREAERARGELAQCLFERRQYDRVLEVLNDCQPATLQLPEIQRLRAAALWEKGRGSEACRLLDEALKLHPRSVSLLRLRAKIHLADNEPRLAAELLRRALEMDPHDRESHHALGQAYQRLGDRDQADRERKAAQAIADRLTAIDQLGKQALRNPWDVAVRRQLARLLREQGQEDQARDWEKSAAACPPAPASPGS
jgi:tetratricopeptide (TPR) repeat protein